MEWKSAVFRAAIAFMSFLLWASASFRYWASSWFLISVSSISAAAPEARARSRERVIRKGLVMAFSNVPGSSAEPFDHLSEQGVESARRLQHREMTHVRHGHDLDSVAPHGWDVSRWSIRGDRRQRELQFRQGARDLPIEAPCGFHGLERDLRR